MAALLEINYSRVFDSSIGAGLPISSLVELLLEEWSGQYRDGVSPSAIFEFVTRGWTFLFDFASEDSSALQVDRVIACCGLSAPAGRPREWAYQRGYPRPPSTGHRPLDKGHMMPHELGGDVSQNIYPQDRALNRGWSADGRRYRALEREAAATAGTFFFCKLEYEDHSAFPFWVELGVLRSGGLHVERFRNRFDSLPAPSTPRSDQA